MTRPFLTTLQPSVGYEQPSMDELRALRRIVLNVHDDWLGGPGEGSELEQIRAFSRAFWAAGHFFRTRETRRDRHYHAWVEDANDMLDARGMYAIGGRDLMLAIIAHGDIVFQRPGDGALAEVGLDRYRGLPCRNTWRQVLTGEANLLVPTPPRTVVAQNYPVPKPRLFQAGLDGRMSELIKW
jgi:hypothetical protein